MYNCEYIKKLSCYNNNCYKLPFEINGNNIVEVHCDEDYDSYDYKFGKLSDEKFIEDENCFCPSEYNFDRGGNDYIFIDSELIGTYLT